MTPEQAAQHVQLGGLFCLGVGLVMLMCHVWDVGLLAGIGGVALWWGGRYGIGGE